MHRHYPIVDATIRQYLTDKVRERFSEDFHLIEPMLDKLVSQYSLKELMIMCSVEIIRLKSSGRREHERPAKAEL